MSKKLLLIRQIQDEILDWSIRNFGITITTQGKQPLHGPAPIWDISSLLGITEELGELNHAILKSVQGIRGSADEHRAEVKDAIGDLLIYLLDFCGRNDFDAEEILVETWTKVGKRDWKADPASGGEK